MDIQLGTITISPDHSPVFVVEAGINHNGSMDIARSLINEAHHTGAQVVKFQHHIPNAEMMSDHPLWDILSKTALDIDQLAKLKSYAESLGLVFLCTPFSFQAVDELESIGVVGFKMGSGELNNIPLQRHVARKGKPMLISTGMSSLREIRKTIDAICYRDNDNASFREQIINRIILMNCCSTYPAVPSQGRLHRLDALRQIHGGLVGQSDHTPTISTCLGAIARGAVVIEKHMTLNRSMEGPDHAASVLPGEFEQMVKMGNEIWESTRRQPRDYDVLELEMPIRAWANHSLVTTREILPGRVIRAEDLTTKRPGDGVPSGKWDSVVGSVAARYMKPGHKLEQEDLA